MHTPLSRGKTVGFAFLLLSAKRKNSPIQDFAAGLPVLPPPPCPPLPPGRMTSKDRMDPPPTSPSLEIPPCRAVGVAVFYGCRAVTQARRPRRSRRWPAQQMSGPVQTTAQKGAGNWFFLTSHPLPSLLPHRPGWETRSFPGPQQMCTRQRPFRRPLAAPHCKSSWFREPGNSISAAKSRTAPLSRSARAPAYSSPSTNVSLPC